MSSQLDEVDQMLLGEGDHHGPGGDLGHETTTTNCGANPLIATAGTLVQVDRRGNEINGTDVSQLLFFPLRSMCCCCRPV